MQVPPTIPSAGRSLASLFLATILALTACQSDEVAKVAQDPAAQVPRDGWQHLTVDRTDSEIPPEDEQPPEVPLLISEPFYGDVGTDRVALASRILGLEQPLSLSTDDAKSLLGEAEDALAGGTVAGPQVEEALARTVASLDVDGPEVDPSIDVAAVLASTRSELEALARDQGVELPTTPFQLVSTARQLADGAQIPSGQELHVRLAMAQQRRVFRQAGERVAAGLGVASGRNVAPGRADVEVIADGHVVTAAVTVNGPAGPLRVWLLGLHPGDTETDIRTSVPRTLQPVTTHAGAVPDAVAAINGGFWTEGADPDGLTVVNGLLVSDTSSGKTWVRDRRPAFGLDGDRAHAGLPTWTLAVSAGGDAPLVPVRGFDRPVNGPADLIGSLSAPAPAPDGTPHVAFDLPASALLSSSAQIRPVADLSAPPAAGTVRVFVTGNAMGKHLDATELRLEIIVDKGFAGLSNVVAGGPTLLRQAAGVDLGMWRQEGFGPRHTDDRHPRTFAGVDRWGNVVLAVVDGRQPGHSVGLNQGETAAIAAALDLVDAVQLDGGGSSTFLVDGRVRNRPSDGAQRPVATALVVTRRTGLVG